jgi:hypothetical protein
LAEAEGAPPGIRLAARASWWPAATIPWAVDPFPRGRGFSHADHPFLPGRLTGELFAAFRRLVLALDPEVTEVIHKTNWPISSTRLSLTFSLKPSLFA